MSHNTATASNATEARIITVENVTKDERSLMLYAETCMVDYGGLLEGVRMNEKDMEALASYKAQGLLDYGRIPHRAMEAMVARACTMWVEFTPKGWEFAHALRRAQCERSRLQSANYKTFRIVMDERAQENVEA